MKIKYLLGLIICVSNVTFAEENMDINQELPVPIQRIMNKARYANSRWGIEVKNLTTGKTIYSQNSGQLFRPASTTKLFTVSALINQLGFDYRFKTPVYTRGVIKNGVLYGDLILSGTGDYSFGGRTTCADKISYTSFDHSYANIMPGTSLTPEDPLNGFKQLAQQIRKYGIRQIKGNIIIDQSYFPQTTQRDTILTPVMINDNLLDFEIIPTTRGLPASIVYRPQVFKLKIINQTITTKNKPTNIRITEYIKNSTIIVSGSVNRNKNPVLSTYPITDPTEYAQKAFLIALKQVGVKISSASKKRNTASSKTQLAATLISPPLIEYGKLILKVSHNTDANLTPLILAATQKESGGYTGGMQIIDQFIQQKLHIGQSEYHFTDAAGGDANLITPEAETKLLEYWFNQPESQLSDFIYMLPGLGVDGTLANVAKQTQAAGHAYLKDGTSVAVDEKSKRLVLTSKALAGYIQLSNNQYLSVVIMLDEAPLNSIEDVLTIADDLGMISAALYH